MKKNIVLFDTTLRDGEQALKRSLKISEKLIIAKYLEDLGIDCIEVGFPISSPNDFKSTQIISKEIIKSKICVLARCVDKDIEVAADSLRFAKKSRIHIFLPTSVIHLQSKIKKDFDFVIKRAVFCIKKAKQYTDDVQFSCEDATRTSIKNLCKIYKKAIQAGANTINIADTVGFSTPDQIFHIISQIKKKVLNINRVNISVHCHNDLGMAVANSISAIQAGAKQIEGTITGFGERAGNAAIEEIAIAIKICKNLRNMYTNLRFKKIYNISKKISKICNITISRYKPIIGSNMFSHASGIHQDGVIKNKENYEIISPKSIGAKNTKINLTSRSGRAALKYYMNKMGYNESYYDIEKLYVDFLKLSDKKGRVFDYELENIAFMGYKQQKNDYFSLNEIVVKYNSNKLWEILLKLNYNKKIYSQKILSKNLIDGIYLASIKFVDFDVTIKKVCISSFQKNKYIIINTSIIMIYKSRKFYGSYCSTNIIKSIIKSIICIFNSILKNNKVKKYIKKNTNEKKI